MNCPLLSKLRFTFLFSLLFLCISNASSQSVLWSEDFESCATNCTNSTSTGLISTTCIPSGWLTKSSYGWIGTSQNMRTGSRGLKFLKNQTGWVMTGGTALTSGNTYQLKFWYRIPAAGSGSGAFKIEAGASTNQSTVPASLTTVVNTGTNSTGYTEITYSYTAPSTGTYYFGLKASSGSSARDAIIIDDMELSSSCTAPSITSQSTSGQTKCMNDPAGFSALTISATGSVLTYQWYSNTTASTTGGTSMGSASGAQTSSFTPPVNVAGTKYYYCVVSGSCSPAVNSAVSGAVTVHGLPDFMMTRTPSGPQYSGTPVTLSVPSGYASYAWTVTAPLGLSVTPATGTSSNLVITTLNNTSSAGTYASNGIEVIVTDAHGCSSRASNTLPPAFHPLPAVPTGTSSRCQGGGTDIYTSSTTMPAASGTTGYSGFYWALTPSEAGSINSATGEVTWNPAFTGTASVSVSAIGAGNSPGTGTQSSQAVSTSVTVSSSPVFISGPTAVTTCDGKPVTFTAETSGTASYTWEFDNGSQTGWIALEDWAGIAGSSTNSMTLSNPGNLKSGISFRCILTAGSCSSTSDEAMLTVLPSLITNSVAENNFDDPAGWSYIIGPPAYYGTGSGTDNTGVKIFEGNKVLSKSFSLDNGTDGKGSSNTVTFSNIEDLDIYDAVEFEFQIASLGSGSGAGNDGNEDFIIQYSTDNGTSWLKIHNAHGDSDRLFDLSVLPVTVADSTDTLSPSQDLSQFRLRLEGINQFQFRFTASNNRTNENWVIDNVKLTGISPALKSTWDEVAQNGSIHFQYANVCDAVGPYHYMISQEGISPLKETYRFMRDSIYGGVLDSATFFLGTYPLLAHTFTELQPGNYYIGVFDSRGELVYAGQEYVGSALVAATQNAISIRGNKIISTGNDSRATFDIFSTKYTRGEMEFGLSGVAGTQTMGFLEIDDVFTDYTQLKNGFHILDDKAYTVKNGVLSSTYTTVGIASKLKISYNEGLVNYQIDNQIVDNITYTDDFTFRAGIKIPFEKFIILKPVVLVFQLTYLNVKQVQGTCANPKGSFSFTVLRLRPGSGSFSYSISGPAGYTATGVGTTSLWHTQSNLEPGTYNITATVGTLVLTHQLKMGVQPEWLQNENYSLLPNINSLTRNNAAAGTFSKALSGNVLNTGQAGWVEFTPNQMFFSDNPLTLSNTPANLSAPNIATGTESTLYFYTTLSTNIIPVYVLGTTPIYMFTFSMVNKLSWKNALNVVNTVTIPANARIRAEIGNTVKVYSNGAFICEILRPTGDIRIKANSFYEGDGFKDILTSFGCGNPPNVYAKLEKTLKGVNYPVFSNIMKFYYDEEYTAASNLLRYTVYDRNNAVALSGNTLPLSKKYGDNRYDLNVSGLSLGTYLLEVTNEKNEKFYLRFTK